MEKITIAGVEFCNFGSNNYSEGMELVSSYPCDPQMIEAVLGGEIYIIGDKQVFLNPSAECHSEFFGVLGTKEQYEKFYKRQTEAQMSKLVLEWTTAYANHCGVKDLTPEEWRFAEFIAKKQYKDWWHK